MLPRFWSGSRIRLGNIIPCSNELKSAPPESLCGAAKPNAVIRFALSNAAVRQSLLAKELKASCNVSSRAIKTIVTSAFPHLLKFNVPARLVAYIRISA